MNVTLLTHERELLKKSGTGKLVKDFLGYDCKIITWKRKEPSDLLSNKLSSENTVLVYPGENPEKFSDFTSIENFIIIDGTWQESNKIYNRSPYLKRFKQFVFPEDLQSSYTLRRNQKKSGLCTIESVIELYRLKGYKSEAEKMESIFRNFQNNK